MQKILNNKNNSQLLPWKVRHDFLRIFKPVYIIVIDRATLRYTTSYE